MNRQILMGAAALLMLGAGAAHAEDFTPKVKGQVMVNFRVTDVSPDANDAITTAAGGATGLHVNVSDSYVPTLGIAYFLSDNVALDLTLGTSNHTVKAVGTGTNITVHKTWVVPPVLTLQYHFAPKARFSPYVGAGVNAMIFYNDKDQNGFTVKLKNGVGAALQAGADWAIQGPWSANVDVKKVFFSTDANINSGALKSSVNLDPWVISVGVGRKF